MTEFDVLAVRGNEAETLHVEPAGVTLPGMCFDGLTGEPVEIIGRVVAADAAAAHAAACAALLPRNPIGDLT